ncbi:MAG: hypothetical protein OCD02_15410 [Spirochaetaceae bacterium]
MRIKAIILGIFLTVIGNLYAAEVSIVPSSFLRNWDPITVFYSSDIGPDLGGPLDDPTEFIKIEPKHPGEYRWIDSRTLQFNPTIPWPPLSNYKITSNKTTQFLSTLMVRPSRVNPSNGSKNLKPVDSITLTFSSEIKIEQLRQITTLEVRPLPGVGDDKIYTISSKDFVITREEGNSNSFVFRLKLNKPIPYGKSISLKLALSTDSSIEGGAAIYKFSTKDDFRIVSMGSGYNSYPISSSGSVYNQSQSINCGTGNSPLFIEFSERPGKLNIDDVKKLVSFEPSVSKFSFSQAGNRIYLNFNVDKETPYKFTINDYKIKSSSGRNLAKLGKTSLYFYYQNLSPYIKWKKGQVITEKYGPKFFPMEGRATDTVDLRIYKIDSGDRRFWPFPSRPVVINEDKSPLMPGEDEYARSIEDHIKLLKAPPVSLVVPLPISKNSGKTAFGLDLEEYFTSISGKNAPGTYLVGYRTLGSSRERNYVKVVVTDLSFTTIEEEGGANLIVTSLDSGLPVDGATITLESYIYNKDTDESTWESQLRGKTDSDGQFYLNHTKKFKNSIGRIKITKDDDILILDTKTPPPSFSGNHWYSRSGKWLGWLTNSPRDNKSEGRVKGYIFTERPVYKPNEEVHILGYVRYREKGLIKKDTSKDSEKILSIYGPGNKTWDYPIVMEGNDQFYHLFNEKDLPTGHYSASIKNKKSGSVLASVHFKKEAYRVPKFEINLTGPDKVPADKPFQVELIADYYAGGRVVAQSVSWNVTKYPYFATSKNYPGFEFATDERFSGYSRYSSIGSNYHRNKTDANGSAKLKLNPQAENGISALRYLIEATVRGADSQTVTDSKEVVALPPFSLGLKVDKFIKDKNEIAAEVILLDFNDKPLEGREFTLRLYKREWHSYLSETDFTTGEAKYISDVVDDKILEKVYKSTGDEATKILLETEESGVYLLEILATDDLGRLQKIKSDFYVTGDTPTSWEKTKSNVFDTILDKKNYNPGDEVTMLLKSPFQSANALVIVETPTENLYHWVPIENGQGIFKLKIKKDMVPGVPVYTLLMRGRIQGSGIKNFIDRGKPISMGNTTWIDVNPESNQLKVNVSHPKVVLPGSTIKMDITLEDSYGNLKNGDVALWLVDRAVLALGDEQRLAPLDAFIDPVYSFLSIRDIRNSVVGNLTVEELSGGGGSESMAKMAEMALAKKSLLDNKTVRKNFKTVAYYNKRIQVRNGKATITINLPDNLTDFAIRAVAVSGYDKFGTTKSVLSVRLPVIIQSAIPRFVRPGDSMVAGGIGRIVEGPNGDGIVQIQSDDLLLNGNKHSITEAVELSRVPNKLFYQIDVPKTLTDKATIEFKMAIERTSDAAGDAFLAELPVSYLNMKASKDGFYDLEQGDTIKFPYPNTSVKKSSVSQIAFVSDNQSIITMFQGLQLLEEYPHGCLEQRISKLYPLLAMENILSDFDLPDSYKVDNNSINSFLIYLASVQSKNGLYSFWPGSTTYVGLTAYTMEFLTLLKENGYSVPENILKSTADSLKSSLRSDSRYLISEYSLRERIDAFSALSNYGYFDKNYASDLLNSAKQSDLYNKAKMVIAYYQNGRGSDKKVKELVSQLWTATTFKRIGKKEVFDGLQYKNRIWGGIIISSEIDTLSKVIKALNLADPKNDKLELMVDYLVKEGGGNGWGSTKATSSALLTLKDSITTEYKKSRSSFSVNSDKTDIKSSLNVVTLKEDDRGTFTYNKGKDPLYVWLQTRYHIAENVRNLKQESTGFLVSSELMPIINVTEYDKRIKVDAGKTITLNRDDVVEQHVTVINSETSNYVAITIPLAAGFDPLNPELLTSPPEAKPTGKITRKPSYAMYLDDKVIYYYDNLPKGTYNFYFRLRATTQGEFFLPPSYAEKMYQMSYRGMSNAGVINIEQ